MFEIILQMTILLDRHAVLLAFAVKLKRSEVWHLLVESSSSVRMRSPVGARDDSYEMDDLYKTNVM